MCDVLRDMDESMIWFSFEISMERFLVDEKAFLFFCFDWSMCVFDCSNRFKNSKEVSTIGIYSTSFIHWRNEDEELRWIFNHVIFHVDVENNIEKLEQQPLERPDMSNVKTRHETFFSRK